MKKLLLISLFIMAVVLSGCAAKYNPDYSEPSLPEINNTTSVVTNQKIYYTVDYRIIDSDIVNSIKNIENVVLNLNGYVESYSSNYDSENGKVTSSHYTFRCPTDKLNSLLSSLDENYKIDYKNLTSTNITTQYVSNEARITTLKASKEAYLKMLVKSDITVNEIILIQKEIETIDTELTELEILKNQYDSLLDYSTIRVTITEKESFVNTYLGYLVTLFTGIFKILLYLLPFIFVASVVLLCVYIYIKKKDKKIKG